MVASFNMSVFKFVNSLRLSLSAMTQGLVDSVIDLETVDNATTLVTKDGSLVTIIDIDGVKTAVGGSEFEFVMRNIQTPFGAMMSEKGHIIQVCVTSDPDGSYADLYRQQVAMEETARRLELNISDILHERTETLGRRTTRERVLLTLWTTKEILQRHVLKDAEKTKALRQKNDVVGRGSQDTMAAVPELRAAHTAAVAGFLSSLDNAGIWAWALPVREAIKEIRYAIDPEWTSNKWTAVVPGDKVDTARLMAMEPIDNAKDAILWPRIAAQVLPRSPERINYRTLRIGDRIYRPLIMRLGPKIPKDFSAFYQRMRELNVPFRLSFRMSSDGLSIVNRKKFFTKALAMTSEHNRIMLDAIEEIERRAMGGEIMLKFSMSAVTWAPEGQNDLLNRRAAQLLQTLSAWGEADWSETVGDPSLGVFSTVPAVTKGDISPPACCPVKEAILELPLLRPSVPWRDGSLLLRSPDGKILPFSPGSSQQEAWIDLTAGSMGSGKSVFGNTKNLALCLTPGIERLPRIAILDIGPNSEGLISLLKWRLPDSKKHLALYEKLNLDERYAINVFDTSLGCREPLPYQRSFIKNFITLLATPPGVSVPEEGVSQVADLVISIVYEKFSDQSSQKGQPKLYQKGDDPQVDKMLEQNGIQVDRHTTWWEIVDALFDKKAIHGAYLAQRHAVPTMNDVIAAFGDEAVETQFKIVLRTGEKLSQYMTRAVTSAVREYKIIGGMTKFDLGEARVVALNLETVAPKGSPSADKQTGVFYMLGLYILSNDFFITRDALVNIPDRYKEYHATRIEEIREDIKHLHFDEFHRTSNFSAIGEQVTTMVREGRKWKVIISLISQLIDDFPQTIQDLATSVFIFKGGGSKKAIEQYKLPPIAERILTYGLRVGSHGADMFARFDTKKGVVSQHMTSTIGPQELWAFSTTAEDVNLRERMYRVIGSVETLRRLAKYYPGGIKSEVERRMATLKEKGDLAYADEIASNVQEEIYQELLKISPS